ncbi:hypothetical protein PTE30175_03233 [Pandoraea terrae]|uniref:DUF2214 domain-containing protein n=1 Tax=Pandoraea terrae TaxID=1537710 RepID=A0A5E4WJD6_9BURK|nr:hypothetical protein [Pandoraea terrae]VVE24581.1 hypothetical protein PTE30175_03233 [Pandoraea terrae]
MEFVRLGIVYFHLIACCVAVGLVLTSDLRMIRQLWTGDYGNQHDADELTGLQSTISKALIVLWITGAAIIWIDVAAKSFTYFNNPKIQAKIGMVVLLTLNGVALHSVVMPALKRVGSLLRLTFSARMLAIFSGAISAVSWFYAALLGVGRPLAWKYSLVQLLAAYPFLVAAGFIMMAALTARAKIRDGGVGFERSLQSFN